MTKFVVTTDQDVVDAKDGKLSLREAVAAAESAGGKAAHTIAFDPTVFSAKNTIQLHKTLTIDAGANIVVDGSRNPGQQVYLTSDGTGFGELVRVAKGATATIRDINLTGNSFTSSEGKSNGYNGVAGIDGSSGTDGVYAYYDYQLVKPMTGTDGWDGRDGTSAEDGGSVTGGIVNAGNLTLERVSLSNMKVTAGAGGDGGHGGNGGLGGEGGSASFLKTAGDDTGTQLREWWDTKYAPAGGGHGGDGGDGGDGGNGGNAAGGIFNTGTLVLRDTEFVANTARGGIAGIGGLGGRGGDGGANGGFYTMMPMSEWHFANMDDFPPPVGGDGGDAGFGGVGGTGGNAASAVLNRGGTVTFDGVQTSAYISSSKAGTGAYGKDDFGRGVGGSFGSSREPHLSTYAPWPDEVRGQNGTGDHPAVKEADGKAGDFVGTSGASFANASFVLRGSDTHVAEGKYAYFAIARIGDYSGIGTVDWKITFGEGTSAADFDSKTFKTSGTATYGQGSKVNASSYIYAVTLDDGIKEGPETFTVTLTSSSGGKIGWSKSLTVTIDDGVVKTPPPILGTKKADPNLKGTATNDIIKGLGGNDKISGLAGNDTIYGGADDDRITGGKGADKLFGGDGKVGQGNDTFVFTALSDSTVSAKGQDIIYDFAKGDRIDLSAIDASAKTKGDQAFAFIGAEKFHGKAGELRFDKLASDTYVYADVNGDKKADFAVHLDDPFKLLKTDFLL